MADTDSAAGKSADDRKTALGRAVSNQLARGGTRIESQSDFNAVLVRGKRPNHVLHGLLTLFSAGFWGIVWAVVTFGFGEKRTMLSVDEFGNVNLEKL